MEESPATEQEGAEGNGGERRPSGLNLFGRKNPGPKLSTSSPGQYE